MTRDNRFAILLAGAGIGAAAGLLLARCSGKDLRKGMRKRAGNAKNFLNEQAETLVNRVETAVDVATNTTDEILDKATILVRRISKVIDLPG